ncbi:tRNA (adenosine(37)-N6)-threonylcarbamoyltransferase complex transferase subunit TsaD [Anaerobranca gottschalkii]|uniref:tRNA N6-adenosine threonylcarbamoyltransferase n=1 Tax=Anaerobranca gottschalkii DSM 13577 TaxID=1120990 RepID=A0A1I0C2J4_9FIRM|nr:tRNA (adenosine(37)-N6)-threonylcarbamoyltransferase complex transferase subunit TsaD [Anaerobranca gottschalkii]SET13634.1 N6-L-threonylcarbamoyladenine synthase [Anaerobranca gottschalkii DSM 13577]
MEKCKILAIETSCDETAVAIVEDGKKILANKVLSQIDIHKVFGGVVPEVASRHHLEGLLPLIDEGLKEAGCTLDDITAVAVTNGPGLIGALLVGLSLAKSLAYSINKPLIPVNHLAGHIYANFLENEVKFPLVALIVSGGHTDLIYMEKHLDFKIMGQTRDDAAGEAFDKIARALGLGYPGGPLVDKLAAKGNPLSISFPKAYLEKNSFDFSFSGLKSAVLNYLHNSKQRGETIKIEDVCASFQKSVVDVLVDKTIECAKEKGVKEIIVAGGVSANSGLRKAFEDACSKEGFNLSIPSHSLCTDNAAMIGCAAYYLYKAGRIGDLDLNAYASMPLNSYSQ